MDENSPAEPIYALVVDDEPANLDFLARLLQQAKLEVRRARDGQTALQIATELGEKLKLIMLDHQLPDQKGVDLLKSLRQQLPNTKILMATMHDDRSMMREAFEAGCTGFLVKPHGFMELFQRVQKAVAGVGSFDSLDGLVFDLHGPRPWRA